MSNNYVTCTKCGYCPVTDPFCVNCGHASKCITKINKKSENIVIKDTNNLFTKKDIMIFTNLIFEQSVWHRFELRDDKHDKFWEISYITVPPRFTTRWARIGNNTTYQTKNFQKGWVAKDAAYKKCQEKLAKGYLYVGTPNTSQNVSVIDEVLTNGIDYSYIKKTKVKKAEVVVEKVIKKFKPGDDQFLEIVL